MDVRVSCKDLTHLARDAVGEDFGFGPALGPRRQQFRVRKHLDEVVVAVFKVPAESIPSVMWLPTLNGVGT